MDLMLRDREFKKVKPIKKPQFACNCGLYGASKNDFELTLSDNEILPVGHLITYGLTEYGGVILDRITDTKSKTVKYIGKSFRGQLEYSIIAVSGTVTLTGTDYDIVNQIIRLSQLDYKVNFTGNENVKTVVLPKGCNALKAIDIVLNEFAKTMKITVSNDGVEISIVPVNTTNYDASQVDLVADENYMLPTAMCAVSNAGTIKVYLQEDGTVGINQYYFGFDAVEVYAELSAENVSELTSLASDRLIALRKSHNTSEIDVKIEDAEIGDKINATIKKHGIKAVQTVSEKILTIDNKNKEISFNLGG